MNADAGTGSAPYPSDLEHLAALDRAGVTWALLRGAEGEGRSGKDLDVLVHASWLGEAERALVAEGFVSLPPEDGSVRSLVRRDQGRGRWTLVDLTTRFAFGPEPKLRLGVEDGVLRRADRTSGASRVARADRFWLLALHAILDHDAFDDRHRRELAEAAMHARDEDDVPTEIDRMTRRPVAAGLRALARGGDWQALADEVRSLHRSVGGRGAAGRRLLARLRRIGRRVPRMLARPGMSVAIIGPDGAGKSSLVRDLPACLPARTQTRYLGLFGASHVRARVRGLGFIRRLGRLWLGVVTDAVALAKGRIVLYDRYPYDMLRARGPETVGRRLRRWIEAHAAPPPDLVILLDAPPELLHRRRPEHSVGELTDLLEHYRSIGRRLDQVETLDASAPAHVVLEGAVAAIWRRYARRVGRA